MTLAQLSLFLVKLLAGTGVFLVGVHLIKLVRRIVKKSMMRANAELGAIQFTDSFIKAALYVLLMLLVRQEDFMALVKRYKK